MKKRITLCLVVIMIMGMAIQSNAATNGNGAVYGCTLTISCQPDGVSIDVETNATKKAKEIGYRDIVLVEKNGGSTREIKIPDGSGTNAYNYGDSYTYKGAVKGRTYYAYCTHYAVFDENTSTAYNSTNEMVYN